MADAYITPESIINTGKSLVDTLSAHPELAGFDKFQKQGAHAVWIATRVNDKGEFFHVLCVAIHPKFGGKIEVPAEHGGLTVEEYQWPVSPNADDMVMVKP